ncbi:MAG: aldehyde dehydrogenase family protein [Myxococcales bacterium]|nr:aldehyde dehydrogenase family protein [Myxococcales bacterium]
MTASRNAAHVSSLSVAGAASVAHEELSPDALGALVTRQRAYFDSGVTLPREFRVERLKAFLSAVRRYERPLLDALRRDLGKSDVEGYATEVGIVITEIRHTLSHLSRWMKPRKTMPSILLQPARGRIHPQPIGLSLIVGPWNYPVNLVLAPLVGAIAAGCTAIIKTSELAPHSARLVAELVNSTFEPDHVIAVTGGVDTARALLDQPFDHYFFTGSTRVGRLVARTAADRLARATLELGGKSPALVRPSCDLGVAARRIAWGKTTNAGQTCVAPDYVLVEAAQKEALIAGIQAAWRAFYGSDPSQSPDYGRIVSETHLRRLRGLIDPGKLGPGRVVSGGGADEASRYLEPTIVDMGPATAEALGTPLMQEEIFGPILPVLTVAGLEDAIRVVRHLENPLALYLFTSDRDEKSSVVGRVSFGGGCINATLVHLGDPDLPFGGVGASGLGAYHGKAGFDAFTHWKSILESATFIDPALRYPPYAGRLGLIKRLVDR